MIDGKIATLTLGESKLPCIADVPPLKTVLVESPTGPTPFGGKAIAENPNVPTAAAIANAIADACGVRLFELPLDVGEDLLGDEWEMRLSHKDSSILLRDATQRYKTGRTRASEREIPDDWAKWCTRDYGLWYTKVTVDPARTRSHSEE